MLMTKQAFSPRSKYLLALFEKADGEGGLRFAATGNIAGGTFP